MIRALFVLVMTVGIVAGCAPADGPPTRGTVLAVTPLPALDAEAVAAELRAAGFDASRVRSGVRSVRVEYATVDVDGSPTRASGLVAVPDRDGPAPIPTVSWHHGTTAFRGDTASMGGKGVDRAAALTFASAGHVVSAPDYLGLGTGPGRHPYSHAASGVTAARDGLLAARSWAQRDGARLDPRVLLTGFSQGGPVTMALGRELAARPLPGVVVSGLAPIDGPFDFRTTLAAALSGPVPNAPAYLAYLTVAWQRLHHLYDRPSEALRPPYDATLEDLISGDRPNKEVMAGLPATVGELFTPRFLERLRRPEGALRAALDQESATCDWTPSVPVRISHARGDRDVPFASAEYCRAALALRGAAATVDDLGDVEHGAAPALALPRILDDAAR